MLNSTKWLITFALGSAMLAAGPAEANAQAGGGGGAPAMTPLQYRKDLMQHLRSHMAELTAVRGGQAGDATHALPQATILHQLALMLDGAFPEGSMEGSRSLPAVWENPDGFAEARRNFQAATQALVEAAASNDAERIAAAQTAVQRACGACHTPFRAPPPGR